MYNKKLINLTAVVIAMSLALTPAMTVCAEDTQAPENTWEKNSGEVVVNTGDVTNNSSQWSAVYAEGEGTVVVENGNATNESDEWRATCAHTNGTVEITGNAEGGRGAVSVNDGTVVVDGNVTGRTGSGLYVTEDSYMIVDGDVTGGANVDQTSGVDGIYTDGSSTVIVEGNVTGADDGVTVVVTDLNGETKCACTTCSANPCTCDSNTGDNKNIVVVEGTIKANDKGVYVEKKNDELINCNIPTIVVYEIDAPTAVAGNTEEVTKYLEEHVQYIVKNTTSAGIREVYGLNHTTVTKVESISADVANQTATKNEQKETLLTTTLNKAFKVAVENGYELSAGDNVEMVDLGGGVYSIRLTNNNGGITLVARLVQVATPVATTTSAPANNGGSSETHEESQEEAPALFAIFSVADGNLPEVLGAVRGGETAESVVRPVATVKASGNLTALQYKRAFIDTIKNAPENALVRLETSVSYCIDKEMMEALASRPDVELNVIFPVANEKVSVTVPAGYDVMSLLDENGYCGFLYLNSVFNK
ncbi:hypothetical protein [Butyrivibrio proteoclasticus]|uniref:hypothetical protein n=1 Tax=Butyrivibrio proteoclasticus TaxID=43305 RepID=UPI00047AB260|nr:hypothetical protein [Butyrivibrio proteoclasticus]